MNTPSVGTMILIVLIGLIALSVYDLVMLVKHKPTLRYVAYGAPGRIVDAVTVMVGVAALLARWFNSDRWTAGDWIIASVIAIYIGLTMACAVLADRQQSGHDASL